MKTFPIEEFPNLFYDKDFNASRPMVVYFHGFLVSTADKSITSLRAAYVDYNFVAIDWSCYSIQPDYFKGAVPQLKIVSFLKS